MNHMIPGMSVTMQWNPNHKCRFYTFGQDLVARWLFIVRFSNKDQSLYLIPDLLT